ncbi:MAG: hypothetical protein FP824_02435 [Euryarchaeota archaeon]|nr:hypothetical protein [Euryarchaeota archaeon]MBU4038035.1 hypothetical protein [Pseudomonadota bacterium]
MDKNEKKVSLFAGLGIMISIGIGALIGWILGLVIWFVFTIFSPINMAPPLIYQIAWAVFGALGFPFLSKK